MKIDIMLFDDFKKQFDNTDKEKIIRYLYNMSIECLQNVDTLSYKIKRDIELLYRGEYKKGNMSDDMQHELANYLQDLLKEDECKND